MTRPRTLPGAPGLPLTALLAALLAPALGCGPTTRDALQACTLDEACGPGARCVAGACQASTPPTADFTLPAALTTNRPVSVTAAASDPDPGDAVATWAWTITRVSAACDADLDVDDAATLQAVFWCPGTYEVSLVVTDAAGAASAPVRRTAAVSLLDRAPTISVGPAVAVDHRCAGTPFTCALEQPVALSADGQAPAGGPLGYRWSALPPDASRASATARLSPSSAAQAPTLDLSTGGGPISGVWRLRVRAEDAAGNLAQATQLVTVGNRPPVLDDTPLSLDHRYQGGAYLASGPVSVPVSDPDGDPVEVELSLMEPPGSGCSAGLAGIIGTSGALSISCGSPAGLQATGRALVASVADANGAGATAVVPVRILNRPPVIQPAAGAGTTALSIDHAVGACPDGTGSCFLAAGPNPFAAVDPDGDPLPDVTLVPGVGAGRPHAVGQALPGPGGGTFRFATPVAWPAEFRSADGTSGFWLSATVADPFGASATAQPALPLRILNRPPVLQAGGGARSTPHRFDAAAAVYLASSPLATFTDPDGDPLDAGASAGDDDCAAFSISVGVISVACARPYPLGTGSYPLLAGFAGAHALVARAGDGWEVTAAPVSLTVASEPPAVAGYTGAVEACTCRCTRPEPESPNVCMIDPVWVADPSLATLASRPADADGDPLHVTFALASGAPTGAAVTPSTRDALPEACAATVSATGFPVTVLVTANDGVSQGSGSWTVTRVTCAKSGQACTDPVWPVTAPLPTKR